MRVKSNNPVEDISKPVTISGRGPIFGSNFEAVAAAKTIPKVNGKNAKPDLSGE